MKSNLVAQLLADLGVTKTHSRPYVSDDNPFSESQFRTMKYRPEFPERFGSIQHARSFCQPFFEWYNKEHHHSGIGLHTPHSVHYGLAQAIQQARHQTLLAAHSSHPERFVNQTSSPSFITGGGLDQPAQNAGRPTGLRAGVTLNSYRSVSQSA